MIGAANLRLTNSYTRPETKLADHLARDTRPLRELTDNHQHTIHQIAPDFMKNSPGMIAGMQSVYEAAGGDDGLLRVAEAWHTRVMADEVVSHAFSHGFHPQHCERLAAYWEEALGGPSSYSERYGNETAVVRIHSGNGQHEEMDQRAIACFDQALEDVGLTDEPLRQVLHDYFAWATTTTMAAYHDSADDVPQGLSIPRWSWDGLQH